MQNFIIFITFLSEQTYLENIHFVGLQIFPVEYNIRYSMNNISWQTRRFVLLIKMYAWNICSSLYSSLIQASGIVVRCNHNEATKTAHMLLYKNITYHTKSPKIDAANKTLRDTRSYI